MVSRMDWGADREVLLRLYRSHIRSKLDYGFIVYGSTQKSYIKMLDTIHKQGLKICLGAFRTSPMESLYVEANEESLNRRRERLSLQYALKVKSTPLSPVCNTIFHPKCINLFQNKPNAIPTFGIQTLNRFQDMNIDISKVANSKIYDNPRWELKIPTIRYDLCKFK